MLGGTLWYRLFELRACVYRESLGPARYIIRPLCSPGFVLMRKVPESRNNALVNPSQGMTLVFCPAV
jgi:hypothetical protein